MNDPTAPVSDNQPGAILGTGPWPNQEPVAEGIDEVSQDPNFVTDVTSDDEAQS